MCHFTIRISGISNSRIFKCYCIKYASHYILYMFTCVYMIYLCIWEYISHISHEFHGTLSLFFGLHRKQYGWNSKSFFITDSLDSHTFFVRIWFIISTQHSQRIIIPASHRCRTAPSSHHRRCHCCPQRRRRQRHLLRSQTLPPPLLPPHCMRSPTEWCSTESRCQHRVRSGIVWHAAGAAAEKDSDQRRRRPHWRRPAARVAKRRTWAVGRRRPMVAKWNGADERSGWVMRPMALVRRR